MELINITPINSNYSEFTDANMSNEFITHLIAKNKYEMCLRIINSKKKSLISNFIKDIFPVPT